MRFALLALVLTMAFACGDDDIGASYDSGFIQRDAATDGGCLPYYLSVSDRDAGRDVDGGAHLGTNPLSCDMRPSGSLDSECDEIRWTFAGGEQITLPGCCTPTGECGGFDPTGALGCIERAVFGRSSMSCTPDTNMDGGSDDAGDEDADVPAT